MTINLHGAYKMNTSPNEYIMPNLSDVHTEIIVLCCSTVKR